MTPEPPLPGADVPAGAPPPPVPPAGYAPPSGSARPPYPPAPPYAPAPPPYASAPPPYAPAPPYAPPRPNRSRDGFAIAGFVVSLLGGVLIGVILSCVALSRIRRSGARGRGLAIAGLVISGVWVVLLILLGSAGLLTVPDEDTEGRISVAELRPGLCLPEVPTGVHITIDVVPCTSPHKVLVVAAFDLPGFAYPGDDEVVAAADEGCMSRLPEELGSREDLEIHFMHPQRRSWALGDHEVTCLVAATDGTLTEDLDTLVPDLNA
jgi:hypothetical protein